MKKIICLLLAIIFALLSFVPIYAEEDAEIEKAALQSQWKIDISCIYDKSKSTVTYNGTVPYDLSKAYKNHIVNLYKLSLTQDVSELKESTDIVPIATSGMSIKLHFSVRVDSIMDAFSKYAVAFVSPEGNLDYISEAVLPAVKSSFLYPTGEKTNFKGIDISSDVSAIKASPSLAVIDIDVDKMYSNESMGYLYTLDDSSIFFSKTFIDELDLKLRTLCVGGASVYLRLITRDKKGAPAITDCTDEENLRILYAVCDFLSSRYDSEQSGEFAGIIIGRSLDTMPEAQADTEALASYIDRLALYSIVAANAMRVNNPSASIVLPISDSDSYSSYLISEKNGVGSTVIERICTYFEEGYGADLDFLIMLETDLTPLGITSESLREGIDPFAEVDKTRITLNNIASLAKYVTKLEGLYSSSPVSVIYFWNVDKSLSGNALACAYAYAYYKLFSEVKINGFVIGFDSEGDTPSAFSDLVSVFKYIDTKTGPSYTNKLLEYFGVRSWDNIIPSYSKGNMNVREHHVVKKAESIPSEAVGEYLYFDYSERTGTAPWYAGLGAKSLSIDYGSTVGRALRAEFSTTDNTEYSYLLWKDIYPENYEFTPCVAVNFSVEGDGAEEKGLFEVKIELGNGMNVIECSTAVSSKEQSSMILDVSDFAEKYLVDYIKISVRPLSDANKDFSLYLSSIVGYSTELDSEELGEAIRDSHTKIRSMDLSTEGLGTGDNDWSVLVTIVIVAILLGVMMFFFLRHEDTEEEEE